MPPVKRKRDAPEQPKGEPKVDGTTTGSSVDPKTDTSYAAAGRGPFPLSASAGLTSVCDILRTRKNIVVLAGAGISVSSGIPDFRSKVRSRRIAARFALRRGCDITRVGLTNLLVFSLS